MLQSHEGIRTNRHAAAKESGGRLLVVLAKTPRSGHVKTRLIGETISVQQAATLARAFLADTLAMGANLALRVPHVRLALDDGGAAAGNVDELRRSLADILPTPAPEIVPQIGATLGERLQNLFLQAFAEGCTSVCAIGSDTPHLPLVFLIEAFGWLAAPSASASVVPAHQPDVVLCPADDGGYCLIGLRCAPHDTSVPNAAHVALFENIAWSSATVFEETMAKAHTLDLRVALLPPFYDVDTPNDLERLRADLARGVITAPRTDAALRNLLPSTATTHIQGDTTQS